MNARMPALLSAIATACLLAACGGGSDSAPAATQPTQEEQYAALTAEATAARAEVVENAASGPCDSDAQCSSLTLRDYSPVCPFNTVVDYSLASPTAAAARAAAERYDRAASEAAALAPPSNAIPGCFENPEMRPLICLENRCQRGFRFTSDD